VEKLTQKPYSLLDVAQPTAGRGLAGRPTALVLSCEHGGNRVPARFAADLAEAKEALSSHRGYDPGALALARALAEAWPAPLVYSTVSRLIVELNRSPHHPRWLSEWTRHYGPEQRKELRGWLYDPYRDTLAKLIEARHQQGLSVLHVSVHSFIPCWRGAERKVDVGLLYDPRRASEQSLCRAWARQLSACRPSWRIRRNQPYRGAADGLTTSFRKRWSDSSYLGVELEVRHDWLDDQTAPLELVRVLWESLRGVPEHT
jgi:predicted N-formylglutamate amidohydrolase